jgi:hypothetical protein
VAPVPFRAVDDRATRSLRRPEGAPPSHAASRWAVVAAFVAVVAGGLSAAAIGFGLVSIDCAGDCGTAEGIGAIVGGLVGAIGVAIVAVLVLRAMAEWRRGGTRQS